MNIDHHWNEKELLAQLSNNSKVAFEQLYHLHSEDLYRNVLRLVKSETEADEILQETFLTIWKQRQSISIHQTFKGYLFRVAENKVYDFFRKLKRDRKLHAYIKELSSSEYDLNEENNILEQESEALQKLIQILPPQQKTIFHLCKIEGKSYEDVSRMLGISTSTVNGHIVKAMHSLRKYAASHPEMAGAGFFLLFYLGDKWLK